MKSIYAILIIILLSACESTPTDPVDPPEEEANVFEVHYGVNLFDLESPAFSTVKKYTQNRFLISVSENQTIDGIQNKAFMDIDHYVGEPDFYIDYGQQVQFGDVVLKRIRTPFDDSVDYTFNYHYNSENQVTVFPEIFNFDRTVRLTNMNEFGQTSSKRIYGFVEELVIDTRLRLENIELDQPIDTGDDLFVEFNRKISTNDNAFGFYYNPPEREPIFMTLKTDIRTSSLKIPDSFIQEFKDRVGLDQFEATMFVVESKELPNTIETTLKSNLKTYETIVITNFVHTKNVVF